VKIVVKRIIGIAIAFIILSPIFINPAKATTYYSEDGGVASTTIEWVFL
jgi:hypothetical protein